MWMTYPSLIQSKMKKIWILPLAGCLLFALVSFTNEILQKLALTEKEAQEVIFGNFTKADLFYPNTKAIRAFALGKRQEAVRQLGAYIRAYTQTPQFNKQYQQLRTSMKPKGPAEGNARLKERLQELKKSIAESEENLKTVAASYRKSAEWALVFKKRNMQPCRTRSILNTGSTVSNWGMKRNLMKRNTRQKCSFSKINIRLLSKNWSGNV
jgi:hypothetical protein